MQIEKREVRKLAHDPNNARTHDRKNIEAIKGSLAKFGQQKPIVIDKGNVVIAGNGTLEAARELGWETIDVVVTTLDKFDKTAFALADNRTAELADWNNDVLDKQLKDLMANDIDLDFLDFEITVDDEELDSANENLDEHIDGILELSELDYRSNYILVTFKDEKSFETAAELLSIPSRIKYNPSPNGNEKLEAFGRSRFCRGDVFLQKILGAKQND